MRTRTARLATLALLALPLACRGGEAPPPAAPTPTTAASAVPAAERDAFVAAWRSGALDDAFAAAAVALRSAPANEEPYRWTGTLCRDLGRPAACLDLWDEAASNHPELALPHSFAGHLLRSLGRTDEALARFAAAAERDPEAPGPLVAAAAIRAGRGEFAEARRALEAAWALDPGAVETALPLAEVRRVSGDYDGADAAVAAALARAPDHADLLWTRARLALRAGEEAVAEAALRRAVTADPRHAGAHAELARLLERGGHVDEARSVRETARRLADAETARVSLAGQLAAARGPAVALLLAETELTAGATQEALRWFARAGRLGDPGARGAAGLAEAWFAAGDVDRGDAALAAAGSGAPGRTALARAARALAVGATAAVAREVGRAVTDGPHEREFLLRASDLLRRAGLIDEADALAERAWGAPRLSVAE